MPARSVLFRLFLTLQLVQAAALCGCSSSPAQAGLGENGGSAGLPSTPGGAAGAGGSAASAGGVAVAGGGGVAGGGVAGAGGNNNSLAGGGAQSGGGGTEASGAPSGGSASQGGSGAVAGPAALLCIGDSITEQADSWIYPMQDALRTHSCKYHLIGFDQGAYNGPYAVRDGYDSKRIAAGGFSTTGILNLIKEKGLGGVPDVVVEYLGVNNVYGGFIDGKYNPDNTANPDGSYIKDNEELFKLARAANPNVTFVLMKIENEALPKIDAAIDQLVKTQSTLQSPVIAVASAKGVETKDGIHPTAAGASTLSGPVAAALSTLLTARGYCSP